MKQIVLLLLISVPFLSCKQDLSTAEQQLYKEVMLVHDEVMPKTKDIYRKQKALQKLDESLEKAEDKIAIRKALKDLEEADTMMFDWMAQFKQRKDLSEGIDYTAYLQKEKNRIDAVSKAMLESIAAAEELIKRHENE